MRNAQVAFGHFYFCVVAVLASLCFFSTPAQAGLTTFGPWVNAYPVQGDLAASTRKEYFLYDNRSETKPWNFGVWQWEGVLTAAGKAEVNFYAYPISFVRLKAGYDGFFRYYNNPVFNCNLVNCIGFAQKIAFSGAALLTFGDDNEYSAIPEYETNYITTPGNTTAIGDESENIVASGNGDNLDIGKFFLGRTKKKRTLGVLVRHAQYRSSGQSNDTTLFLVKTRWRDSELDIGAGYYASSTSAPGTTAFASMTWYWGQTLTSF